MKKTVSICWCSKVKNKIKHTSPPPGDPPPRFYRRSRGARTLSSRSPSLCTLVSTWCWRGQGQPGRCMCSSAGIISSRHEKVNGNPHLFLLPQSLHEVFVGERPDKVRPAVLQARVCQPGRNLLPLEAKTGVNRQTNSVEVSARDQN
jgi:hypothetical protein